MHRRDWQAMGEYLHASMGIQWTPENWEFLQRMFYGAGMQVDERYESPRLELREEYWSRQPKSDGKGLERLAESFIGIESGELP
jgi:hypothetical protein